LNTIYLFNVLFKQILAFFKRVKHIGHLRAKKVGYTPLKTDLRRKWDRHCTKLGYQREQSFKHALVKP